MSEFQRPIPVRGDDVSGHAFAPNEDVEPHRDTDDTESHMVRRSDAEASEDTDDTEGHAHRRADAESAEDDDVEGHIYVQETNPQGGPGGF